MKKSIAIALLSVLLTACNMGKTEKTESTVSEIEAAQMEGRNAAREFLHKEWTDSLELYDHLLEVVTKKSRYQMEGRKAEQAAFDSVFISTIRTVRPGLANEIERQRERMK